MAWRLSSQRRCFCFGREQARAIRDFAAMADSTWGRSGGDDARVSLLRLLLQVSKIFGPLHTDQPHCAVQHCRPHVSHVQGVHKLHMISLAPGGRGSAGRVGSAGGSLGTRRSELLRQPWRGRLGAARGHSLAGLCVGSNQGHQPAELAEHLSAKSRMHTHAAEDCEHLAFVLSMALTVHRWTRSCCSRCSSASPRCPPCSWLWRTWFESMPTTEICRCALNYRCAIGRNCTGAKMHPLA